MKDTTLCRVSDATLIEPLVNHWLAWSFLIAPTPASLHLHRYQLPLLRSFLDDPALHETCSKDPDLSGGAFVDLPATRVPQVQQLVDDSMTALAPNLAFAESLIAFSNRLAQSVDGGSLVPWYDQIPEPLRGRVELVYDYHNRPNVRVLEGIVYDSPLYRPDLQALRFSRLDTDAARPFFVNTPRFAEVGEMLWNVPFETRDIDWLCATDIAPRPFGEMREVLRDASADDATLERLFTAEPRRPFMPHHAPGIRVRYFGHACLLLEWQGVSVLTDPMVPVRPASNGATRFSYDALPDRIDYALVTHNHQDHCSLETLLRLRHRIETLVVPRAFGVLYGDISLRRMAEQLGFRRVVEMDTFDRLPVDSGEIIAVPFLGEHADLAHAKSAYVISAEGRQILVAADSDCLDPDVYTNVRATLGIVDTVFLGTESVGAPMSWLNGALLPQKALAAHDQERRQRGSDGARAISILRALGATTFFNYAMGFEPWMYHLLGLTLDDDTPQGREAQKVLQWARAAGFASAEQLRGPREFLLLGEPESAKPARRVVAV